MQLSLISIISFLLISFGFVALPEPADDRGVAVTSVPTVDLLPSDCEGCAKESLTWGDGITINVIGSLAVGNGQCDGTAPECEESGCDYPAGQVKIKNQSGGDLWWSSNASYPRTLIADGQTLTQSFPAGSIDCGDEINIAFWNTDDDTGVIVGLWGWKCTDCN